MRHGVDLHNGHAAAVQPQVMTEQGSTAILQPGTRADIGAVPGGVGSVAAPELLQWSSTARALPMRAGGGSGMRDYAGRWSVPLDRAHHGPHIWSERMALDTCLGGAWDLASLKAPLRDHAADRRSATRWVMHAARFR